MLKKANNAVGRALKKKYLSLNVIILFKLPSSINKMIFVQLWEMVYILGQKLNARLELSAIAGNHFSIGPNGLLLTGKFSFLPFILSFASAVSPSLI